jgi:hypothetical protein
MRHESFCEGRGKVTWWPEMMGLGALPCIMSYANACVLGLCTALGSRAHPA